MESKWKKIKNFFQKENSGDIAFFNDDEDDKPKQKRWWNHHKKEENETNPVQLPNLKEPIKKHKNRNIFLNFRRRNTLQIIKHLEAKGVYNCFFYTDVDNISLILEQGIRPINQIKLLSNQEYTVWTYLEHATYLELELGNSTRHFFWKWCLEQNVDLNKIAIISVNVNKLFETTQKDWGLNLDTNRIQIEETIRIGAIDWILVKDKGMFRLANMYIEKQNLKIKLYQGNDDQLGKV